MNKKPAKPILTGAEVAQLVAAIALLRLNGFETVSEASLFFTIAAAEFNGGAIDISELSRTLEMPMSTASRLTWLLHERGLVEYESDAADRRRKIVHAKLGGLK